MSLPKWLQILQTVAPTVLACTPLAPIAPFVVAGIQAAEASGGAGPHKLATALNITRIGIAAVNAQAQKTIIDPQLSDAALTSGINLAVQITNTLHRDPALQP